METEFITSSFITLGINLLYTFISLLLAIFFLLFTDKVLLKNIDLQLEIKKGNIAAAIFASTIMMFIVLLITSNMR